MGLLDDLAKLGHDQETLQRQKAIVNDIYNKTIDIPRNDRDVRRQAAMPKFDNPEPPKTRQQQYDEFMQLQPLRVMGAFNDTVGAAGGFLPGSITKQNPEYFPQHNAPLVPVANARVTRKPKPVPVVEDKTEIVSGPVDRTEVVTGGLSPAAKANLEAKNGRWNNMDYFQAAAEYNKANGKPTGLTDYDARGLRRSELEAGKTQQLSPMEAEPKGRIRPTNEKPTPNNSINKMRDITNESPYVNPANRKLNQPHPGQQQVKQNLDAAKKQRSVTRQVKEERNPDSDRALKFEAKAGDKSQYNKAYRKFANKPDKEKHLHPNQRILMEPGLESKAQNLRDKVENYKGEVNNSRRVKMDRINQLIKDNPESTSIHPRREEPKYTPHPSKPKRDIEKFAENMNKNKLNNVPKARPIVSGFENYELKSLNNLGTDSLVYKAGPGGTRFRVQQIENKKKEDARMNAKIEAEGKRQDRNERIKQKGKK